MSENFGATPLLGRSNTERIARKLILRLSKRTKSDEMDRNRSPKSVFPAHINLNLQALPAQNLPKFIRRARRQGSFEIRQEERAAANNYGNRVTLQNRGMNRLFQNSPQEGSRTTNTRREPSRSRSDKSFEGFTRFNEPSSRPSYDQSQNQRGQTGLADAAFVVRDRKAYQEEFRDDSSTVSSTRPSRMSSRPGSSKRTVREMNQDRKLLERLDLENRQLEKVPDLRQEESLKLINLQQNRINDLTNLKYLWNLVFLDLYDNEISNLFHLQPLINLRVLMLGKNKIDRIHGLENLTKLDVLDMHSNNISELSGLTHQSSLRVLNLAGNKISQVHGLQKLESLAELNVSRNQVVNVQDLEKLPYLASVYLSYNKIAKWEDIWCLGDSVSLKELALDGNPLTFENSYRYTVLASGIKLKMLDAKRVSDEERRMASSLLKKELEKKRSEELAKKRSQRRQLAIDNVLRLWKSENRKNAAEVVSPDLSPFSGQVTVLDIGDSHLIEYWPDSKTVRLFGTESIQHVEKVLATANLGGQIHAIHLRYAAGAQFLDKLPRLRSRLPSLTTLFFGECGLSKMALFDKLVDVNISHLNVDQCNPVTKLKFWRLYVIQKSPSIKKINGLNKSEAEIQKATTLFTSISSQQSMCPTYRHEIRDLKLENSDRNRFSPLLGECQQLDRRRQRLADALPAVFLSVVRDCTSQLLDVNWDEYTHETIQSK